MAVRINLRRDLPKALAIEDQLLENLGSCRYTAPCVIGAMVPQNKRLLLDTVDPDDSSIGHLIGVGEVVAPKYQHDDLRLLQEAFDSGLSALLHERLSEMRAKYLPEGSAA